MVNVKNLLYFTETYPDENERYWAVSSFLQEFLDEKVLISQKTRKELLEFMREYTIKRTGLDPNSYL